jgi:hypothetical protein
MDQAIALNNQLFSQLARNPTASEAVNEFTRRHLREDGFFRKFLAEPSLAGIFDGWHAWHEKLAAMCARERYKLRKQPTPCDEKQLQRAQEVAGWLFDVLDQCERTCGFGM